MKKVYILIIVLLVVACLAVCAGFGVRNAKLQQRADLNMDNYYSEKQKNDQLEEKVTKLEEELQAKPEPQVVTVQPEKSSSVVKLLVPTISQNPELPNGCEITSATMALNYWGFKVDKEEMCDKYLPKGEPYYEVDPEKAYMGDPRKTDEGWYCLTGPIVEAINAYLKDQKVTDIYAEDISGASVTELKELLATGHPVIFWATVNFGYIDNRYEFKLPDGSYPYTRLHCMVLSGYDDEVFYLSDPMGYKTEIEFNKFTPIYEGIGRRAVVIKDK